jgi:hypothetical protein
MPLLFNDAEHWRKLADEARDLARRITDPVGKQALMDIATSYDRLALRAAEQLINTWKARP